MCGIFTILNNTTFSQEFINAQFQKGVKRGPDNSQLTKTGLKVCMGFHRLSIHGLTAKSNQPLVDEDITLICNGEIYNYVELYKYMNISPKTDSDCEVIIHLYRKYGIEHTLQMLDGVFSFVLVDNSLNGDNRIFVARDPYGVRPLYILRQTQTPSVSDRQENIIAVASELKVLYEFYSHLNDNKKKKRKLIDNEIEPKKYELIPFPAGTYSSYILNYNVISNWTPVFEFSRYHSTGFNSIMYCTSPQYDESEIVLNIQRYLIRAVDKMCSTERPMACLLSGGLDSSIIAGLVRQYHVTNNLPTLETYSIGIEGSEDLKYARMVANYLETKHTEIVLKPEDFLKAIPEVIREIESYDTTTVRASIGNYLLGKYISMHSDAKVVFNGDGSDELFGGYLYMYLAPDSIEFDREIRRLLKDIHLYDVLRSDKSMGSNGLESRSPFLDRALVQYYLSIPPQVRFHTPNDKCEKYLLRIAFSGKYYRNSANMKLLPDEVLWRTKEAFSDGVTSKKLSLFQIINDYATEIFACEHANQENIQKMLYGNGINMFTEMVKHDVDMREVGNHLVPFTAEQYMYRKIFESYYRGMGAIVPYFWMPKYIDANDPSARTLEIYNDEEE